MQLSFVDALGFHYTENRKFVKSPSYVSHKTANHLVQIKQTSTHFGLFTMKPNDSNSKNEEWKKYNPYLYYSESVRQLYGSVMNYPSYTCNRYLRVFMLNLDIAEQFLKTNEVYLPKTEYKDISLIVDFKYLQYIKNEKGEDVFDFKYEYADKKLYDLPETVVPKQARSKATERSEDNLVKVGSQLVARPMRKVS